jgi:hypothetical protein
MILLFLFFTFTHLTLWALILAPGIAQGIYQNWKWPLEVAKELKIKITDIQYVLRIKFRILFTSKELQSRT